MSHPTRKLLATATVVFGATFLLSAIVMRSRSPSVARAAVTAPSSGGDIWGAAYFPNIALVSHRGEQLRFFDDVIAGKVVVLNFMYTTCADACPAETARLLEVQKLLGDRVGKDVFFYSISIDPTVDTPQVLARYAANWKTHPSWTFLTGSAEDIILLRKKLGMYDPDAKKRDHIISLMIGNQRTGRWMKRSPFDNPHMLANTIGSWLHNWKMPTPAHLSDTSPPEIRNVSSGELLFRTRCATCHTIGGGETSQVAERRVGPDLYNIHKQRERSWLVRWIAEPDRMLAERDPLAVQLLAQYNNVAMPNFRLGRSDIDALLAHIEDTSAIIDAQAEKPATSSNAGATPLAQVRAIPGSAMGRTQSMLAAYEAARAHFANDDLDAARGDLGTLARVGLQAAEEAGVAGSPLRNVALAAATIGDAPDIDGARVVFAEVSRHLVHLLSGEPGLRTRLALFECTMAKTSFRRWAQPREEPRPSNPYWGKQMLTCGDRLDDWSVGP